MPMNKLHFMLQNLAEELAGGRNGNNGLYDDQNLLTAFGNAVYDLNDSSLNLGRKAREELTCRLEIFRTEILCRMASGR